MDQRSCRDMAAAWPRFDDVPLCLLRRHEGAVLGSRGVAREGWRAWLALHGDSLPSVRLPGATARPNADRAAG